MAHQRFIFQESECWCPLKEDVKVDDGLGKLAFWKPKSNLTQAQNELSAFTLIFFIILFVNMRYAPLSFSGIAAHIIQYLFPLVIGTSSLRSLTEGSIFNRRSSTEQMLSAKPTNCFPPFGNSQLRSPKSKFHIICWLISFARLCNGASALYFPREWMLVSSERGW